MLHTLTSACATWCRYNSQRYFLFLPILFLKAESVVSRPRSLTTFRRTYTGGRHCQHELVITLNMDWAYVCNSQCVIYGNSVLRQASSHFIVKVSRIIYKTSFHYLVSENTICSHLIRIHCSYYDNWRIMADSHNELNRYFRPWTSNHTTITSAILATRILFVVAHTEIGKRLFMREFFVGNSLEKHLR